MKNSEKYEERILKKIKEGHTIKEAVVSLVEEKNGLLYDVEGEFLGHIKYIAEGMDEEDCFEWLNENVPLLTDDESKMLIGFCKPYASEYHCISITKREQPYMEDYHYLEVMFESSGGNFYVDLPPMCGKEYFGGLDLDKEYSLEELGLHDKVYKEQL